MKAAIITVFLLILSNCDISPRKANAQEVFKLDAYQIAYKEINGMKFMIIVPGTYSTYTGPSVVNLTKDALEVELIKLQIEALKRQK